MNTKQQVFHDMLLGTLIYTVVLGFFNDYTAILSTSSYSTTFALAIILQLLTTATLFLKGVMVKHHKKRKETNKLALIMSVWLILFFSKFIFLAVIDRLFGSEVQISGFVGLMLMIVCMTVLQKVAEIINQKLDS